MASAGKVVLVTGGSSGLGLAICQRLLQQGHRVYGTSRKDGDASLGYALLRMDVTDEVSVLAAVQRVIDREGRIDVVVNNAGLGIQGPAEDIDPFTALRLFDTNLIGVHRVCRAVLPRMRQQRSGLIINISSVAANFGLPYRAFYSASKAALDRYSESLRMELVPFNIQVVTVQPGEFRTNIAAARLRPSIITADYNTGYERAMEILDGSLSYSRDPDELARVIQRIVADPASARTTYRVAQGRQKLSVLLKHVLPAKMFERMVRRHYE